jgi:hypothetical protein
MRLFRVCVLLVFAQLSTCVSLAVAAERNVEESVASSVREYFAAAAKLLYEKPPFKLSSGSYKCLHEELSQLAWLAEWRPDADYGAVCVNAPQITSKPAVEILPRDVIELLDDDSPGIRLAAAIWLFEQHDLWWISQLKEPLLTQIETKAIEAASRKLLSDDETLRQQGAALLARLRTSDALATLIDFMENEKGRLDDDFRSAVRRGLGRFTRETRSYYNGESPLFDRDHFQNSATWDHR